MPEFTILGTLKEGYTVLSEFMKALRPFPIEDDEEQPAANSPRTYNLRPRQPVNYREA